jgi:hypothetical protein
MLKKHPSGKFPRRDQSETPIEQTQSPLANAVSDAIAKFEAAELVGDQLRELSKQMHYLHPEAHDYAPEEERLAIEFFGKKIAAARDTMLRFKNAILAEHESEALAALSEFVDRAFIALVTINWSEFERQLITLSYAANRLSQPSPPRPLAEWMRIATSIGWDADEREWIETELLRDQSVITSIDVHGFSTSSGRRVDRQVLRDMWAPHEQPWRGRFYERLPRIPG